MCAHTSHATRYTHTHTHKGTVPALVSVHDYWSMLIQVPTWQNNLLILGAPTMNRLDIIMKVKVHYTYYYAPKISNL